MANPETSKVPPSTHPTRQKGRRPPLQIGGRTVGYAVSGTDDGMREAVDTAIRTQDVLTLLVPGTPAAESALKKSKRFRRVSLHLGMVDGLATGIPNVAQSAGIDAGVFEPDARAKAILRGRIYANHDLRTTGGAYEVDDVRTLLAISRQAVDKRVKNGTLLAVPGPSGRRRFPTVQFDSDGGPIKGLKQVQEALGFSSPWAVLNFLVNGNDRLGGERPIDVLRRGDIEQVVASAESIGFQGA